MERLCGKCGKEIIDFKTENQVSENAIRCSACLVNVRPAKIGDIFVHSWGYDQTNATWFQVIGLTAKSVKLRKIKCDESFDSDMVGVSTPRPNDFEWTNGIPNKAFTKRLYYYNGVPHIRMEYGSCELWDGKPEDVSCYH